MARRLNTINDVRRFLASLITRLEPKVGDELDPALAGRLAYIANILVKCIESSDIERRLSELENLTRLEKK
ncbi:MAG: hypothetical protein M0Z81_11835 [Deltaproteobacteria bacterium]|jgi:hypothetical protein|nr:hypothetical protein [Deltaproteobacteria bacterium]